MLTRDFLCIKKKFYYSLFLRSIFLSFNYFVFFHFLSYDGFYILKLRKFLLKLNINLLFSASSFFSFVFKNNFFFNFIGSKVFLLYTNSLSNFFLNIKELKEKFFLFPYVIIFQKFLLKPKKDFLTYYNDLFLTKSKNFILFTHFLKIIFSFFYFVVYFLKLFFYFFFFPFSFCRSFYLKSIH